MMASDIVILLILIESQYFKGILLCKLAKISKRKTSDSCFILNTSGFRHIEEEDRIHQVLLDIYARHSNIFLKGTENKYLRLCKS